MQTNIMYLLVIAFIIISFLALIIIFFMIIRFSDRIILRWYNAHEAEDAEIARTLKTLAERSGIPCPKLYTTESSMANVFSVGKRPENASIIITTEAIKLLSGEELRSVFAHEMFHIKNKDLKTATTTAALGGILMASATLALWGSMFLGFGQKNDPGPRLIRFFVMSLVAPHAAFMVQLTKPVPREYAADAYCAKLYGRSEKLADALKKMGGIKHPVNPAHVHLFIINPLGTDEIFNSLFDTHPQTDERIKRLNELTS